MAYEFYYEQTKTFDEPSASQPKGAITTYYRATQAEKELLFDYVKRIVKHMEQDLLSDPGESTELYGTELPGNHKHKGGNSYTMAEVIMDLYEQINKQKDPTESMINRWNVIFEHVGGEEAMINPVQGKRPKPGQNIKLKKGLFTYD